ncbi:MAG: hypothetical protein R6W79_01365 [Acidimicrobiia bacterium]
MRERIMRVTAVAVCIAFAAGLGLMPCRASAQMCSDGLDNDLDGLADFPADPDCSDAADNSEVDPFRVGGYQLPFGAKGIDVDGTNAYLAYSHFGLAVFDVTDPLDPVLIGNNTDLVGSDIEISGGFAYVVSDRDSMLYVIDISTPASPVLTGRCPVTNITSPNAVTVSGNFAYVGAYQYQNLQIFDVTDPANPHLEGELIDSRVSCQDIAVAGDYAYCPNLDIDIIDVSNPASPTYAGSASTSGNWMYGITASDGKLYATGCYLIKIYDLSTPTSPALLGGMDIGTSCGTRIQVDSGHAVISQDGDGVRIVDVSDPSAPTNLSLLNTDGSVVDAAVAGDWVYVADDWGGFRIVDTSDPSTPSEVASFTASTTYLDVFTEGTLAYAADGAGRLVILDVIDPSSPSVLGTYATGGRPEAVWVTGDHAFLADGQLGLVIVDVSTPASPSLASTTSLADEPVAVEVVGDLLFIAEGPSGGATLAIFDVSDPTAPAFEGSCAFTADFGAGGLDVDGGLAFVSLGPGGGRRTGGGGDSGDDALGVVDVSNASSPSLLVEHVFLAEADSVPKGLDIAGGYAYITTSDGLFIVDVSTPASPVNEGSYAGAGLTDVEIVGGLAYLASVDDVNEVVNVTNPAAPYLVGAFTGAQRDGRSIVVHDGLAYIAADRFGLQIVGFDRSDIFDDGFESADTRAWSAAVAGTP